MNILIISHYFPPMNSIASLRPLSWAKYWSRDGHSVTVLTSKKNIQSEINPVERENFSVIEYDTIYSRFLSQRQTAKEAISSENDRRAGSIIKFFHSIFGKMGILTWDARMPNMVSTNIRAGYKKVEKKWDLVVSTFSPYSSHLIAYKLKRNRLAEKWIADYRDLWTQTHMYSGLFPFTIFEKVLERRINNLADVVTTVSKPLMLSLIETSKKNNVHVIENGFDLDDLSMVPEDKYWIDNKKIRLLYSGNIYAGFRDPSPLFKAITELSKEGQLNMSNLEVVFVGNLKGDLDILIDKFNVKKWVSHLGMKSRSEVLHMQRDADVLLFLEKESAETKGILTGKIFEYIASGTKIWAIGLNEGCSVQKIFRTSEQALFLGVDVNRIKSALMTLLMNKYSKKKYSNSELLDKYSRKSLAQKMLRLVD